MVNRHPGSNPGWVLIQSPGAWWCEALRFQSRVVVLSRDAARVLNQPEPGVHYVRTFPDAVRLARKVHPGSEYRLTCDAHEHETPGYRGACSDAAIARHLRHPGYTPPAPDAVVVPVREPENGGAA